MKNDSIYNLLTAKAGISGLAAMLLSRMVTHDVPGFPVSQPVMMRALMGRGLHQLRTFGTSVDTWFPATSPSPSGNRCSRHSLLAALCLTPYAMTSSSLRVIESLMSCSTMLASAMHSNDADTSSSPTKEAISTFNHRNWVNIYQPRMMPFGISGTERLALSRDQVSNMTMTVSITSPQRSGPTSGSFHHATDLTASEGSCMTGCAISTGQHGSLEAATCHTPCIVRPASGGLNRSLRYTHPRAAFYIRTYTGPSPWESLLGSWVGDRRSQLERDLLLKSRKELCLRPANG